MHGPPRHRTPGESAPELDVPAISCDAFNETGAAGRCSAIGDIDGVTPMASGLDGTTQLPGADIGDLGLIMIRRGVHHESRARQGQGQHTRFSPGLHLDPSFL